MSFAVVLDACVLYPATLRDTLLRLAETGMYKALWSADILDELRRNLEERGLAQAAVEHLVEEMSGAFEAAQVHGFHHLIDQLECDPKDRRVLAAAIHSGAGAIITFNLKDFPAHALAGHGIDAIHPDEFLLDLLDLSPTVVQAAIRRQATANRNVPRTVAELLGSLQRAGVPDFVEASRKLG